MHDGDFRVRGKEISRIEGLSDAVFGFAITLLAISLEVPKTSLGLNAVLLFLVLIFVYPLKFIMTSLMDHLLRQIGVQDPTATTASHLAAGDKAWLFVAFGFGIAAVFALFSAMYRHAYEQRGSLQLDAIEEFDTQELIWATTGVSLMGSAIGLSYLIGALAPRVSDSAEMVGSVAVLVILWRVVHRRRSRSTRRVLPAQLAEGVAE